MNQRDVPKLDTETLKEKYIKALLLKDKIDVGKGNRLLDTIIVPMEKEFFVRGEEKVFLQLMEHENKNIRKSAATISLIVDEKKAIEVLKKLMEEDSMIKYTLQEWENGNLKKYLLSLKQDEK